MSSPRNLEHPSRGFSSHGGPTEQHFDRGSVTRGETGQFEGQEGHYERNFQNEESDFETSGSEQRQSRYIEQLEAVKKQQAKKELEMKRELERMQSIERQRKIEMEKKLELEQQQKRQRQEEEREREKEAQRKREEAERAKQLEQKRLEEEAIAQRENNELEKKRQLDQQLAQEIENKKREMERILEQKERMERELMEKQVELGRMGGGGAGEEWSGQAGYHQDRFSEQERADQPTIPSWNSDPSSIPGLGELKEQHPPTDGEGGDNYHSKSQEPPPEKNQPENTQMMESLGKIVSQLQTLQGLKSSLKLLQTLPKNGSGGGGGGGGGRDGVGVSEGERAAMREKELTEDTKRKVAALLANESDSDGEQVRNDHRFVYTLIEREIRINIYKDLDLYTSF